MKRQQLALQLVLGLTVVPAIFAAEMRMDADGRPIARQIPMIALDEESPTPAPERVTKPVIKPSAKKAAQPDAQAGSKAASSVAPKSPSEKSPSEKSPSASRRPAVAPASFEQPIEGEPAEYETAPRIRPVIARREAYGRTAAQPAVPAEPAPAIVAPETSAWEMYDLGEAFDPGYVYDLGIWTRFDFLLAWRRERRFPILVSTGTAPDNGELDQASTRVLFGGGAIDGDVRGGGRVTLGRWFDADETLGVAGRFWALGDDHLRQTFTQSQFPVLSRPVHDVAPLVVDPVTAFPAAGTTNGRIDIRSDSDLMGVEANFLRRMYGSGWGTVDLHVGWTFTRFDEDLVIEHRFTAVDPVFIRDVFEARNEFHGGTLGLLGNFWNGPFSLNLVGKVSLGNTRETAYIRGVSSGTGATSGLLAEPSNIGRYRHNEFSVHQETGVSLSYHLSDRLAVSFGYLFLFWSDMLRSGSMLETFNNAPVINSAQLVPAPPAGLSRPRFEFVDSSFWVHSLTFGVELAF